MPDHDRAFAPDPPSSAALTAGRSSHARPRKSLLTATYSSLSGRLPLRMVWGQAIHSIPHAEREHLLKLTALAVERRMFLGRRWRQELRAARECGHHAGRVRSAGSSSVAIHRYARNLESAQGHIPT